ncbi:MAG: hypothetical protein RR324_01310 [Cellulosilyticaceae bacterium]
MQLATILPTHYLSLIEGDPYHMALAHLVGKDKEYTEFYQRQRKEHNSYVIMDNGVIEDAQQTITAICKKAELIGANEIILPDVYKDCDATLESTNSALEYVKKFCPHLRTMAVPQGNSLEEWLDCARFMLDWDIDVIGIPKVLTSLSGRDARLQALLQLKESFPKHMKQVEIHLLGCWENPIECTMIAKAEQQGDIPAVRGCDSAIAYVYARDNMRITQGPRPSGKIDFGAKDANDECLVDNIEIWKNSVIVDRGNVTKVHF